MPKITVYPSGVKAAFTPEHSIESGGARGRVQGWSAGAARRCDLFLRSVDFNRLLEWGFIGYCFTGTVAFCPDTPEEWSQMVELFKLRLKRTGAKLVHYVTEWQLRSRYGTGAVPHLHLVAFFPPGVRPSHGRDIWKIRGPDALLLHWLDLASCYGAMFEAQHCELIRSIEDWFKYLAKHAARGASNVQRNPETLPPRWEKTPRMWGKSGSWPVMSIVAQIDDRALYALRRALNKWLIARCVKSLPELEQRALEARGERQKRQGAKLLSDQGRRLRYLQSRMRKTRETVGRVAPISEWFPVRELDRWLQSTCELLDYNTETGEVGPFYRYRW